MFFRRKEFPIVCASRTIEFVLQSSTTCQGHTVRFLARQEDLQEQTEGIVAQRPQCNLGIKQAQNAFFRPTHFTLELVEGQGRGAEEGRCRTPRHIIADESEGINKNRKTEDDSESS